MSKGSRCRLYADIMALHPEVTGSCNLVVVKMPDGESVKFVVDCGLFQERDYDKYNDELPFNPSNIDFALVTHNHLDHIGRLPLLVRKGFGGNIYMTQTTAKLIRNALRNNCKIIGDYAKYKGIKPIYTDNHVEQTLKLRRPCRYGETVTIGENIKVTFFMNGHLPGAALILVQITYPGYEDINMLFTGDYNYQNMFFDVQDLPEWVTKLPITIIQESTYGDKDSKFAKKECFKENVKETISRGGSIITPVFSLGRSQEVSYVLKCMQEDRSLSKDIPIYLDGKLAIQYTNLYINDGLDNKENMRDFLPYNFEYVNKTNRQSIIKGNECKIILTTSGMGSYGPAQAYITEYLSRKNCLIQFCGYCAEDTLGYRLKNAEEWQAVEIGGMIVKKKANVQYTTEFSAHAKADELITFLKKFSNLKLVLVNHGETEVKNKFAERILEEVDAKNVGILGADYLFRVNTWGIVKTIPTKFYK